MMSRIADARSGSGHAHASRCGHPRQPKWSDGPKDCIIRRHPHQIDQRVREHPRKQGPLCRREREKPNRAGRVRCARRRRRDHRSGTDNSHISPAGKQRNRSVEIERGIGLHHAWPGHASRCEDSGATSLAGEPPLSSHRSLQGLVN